MYWGHKFKVKTCLSHCTAVKFSREGENSKTKKYRWASVGKEYWIALAFGAWQNDTMRGFRPTTLWFSRGGGGGGVHAASLPSLGKPQSYPANIQLWIIIGPPAKRHFGPHCLMGIDFLGTICNLFSPL